MPASDHFHFFNLLIQLQPPSSTCKSAMLNFLFKGGNPTFYFTGFRITSSPQSNQQQSQTQSSSPTYSYSTSNFYSIIDNSILNHSSINPINVVFSISTTLHTSFQSTWKHLWSNTFIYPTPLLHIQLLQHFIFTKQVTHKGH